MSLKVEYDGAVGLPIYGFLLMVNSNIGCTSKLLHEIYGLEIWVTLSLTFQAH